jgi:4a-hydroxytetrahydrobiopterin dehydratase
MATPLEDQVLDADSADNALTHLEGWQRKGKSIHKEYTFGSFMEAIDFVNRVAKTAEQIDHHPDIKIEYKDVELTLSTHKHNAITQADITLAERIDQAA